MIDYEVRPSTTQAGGHPNLEVFLYIRNSDTLEDSSSCNCADARNIIIDMPAGVIADPHALPQCDDADFAANTCPISSQIGLIRIGFDNETPPVQPLFPSPVYNLTTHPGQAGLFGFPAPILNSPVFTIASARTEGDYGLNLSTTDITHVLGLGISVLEEKIWGIPAEPANDLERLGPQGCDPTHTSPVEDCVEGFSSTSPPRAYLNNPTTCGEPLLAGLDVQWYDHYRESTSAPFPVTTGCDQLAFNPSLFGRPTTTEADTASGFDVDLTVPQSTDPSVPLSSSIHGADVTLPEGFSINANAADGKTACTDAEAHFDRRDLAADCPEFSKIGTLSIESSALPGPLPGFVYLAEPKPGERYRLLLIADGFGIHTKIPGRIVPDPVTGRVRVAFDELPQFPFSRFNMHLFGSERGVLATPTRCGTYPVESRFKAWNSALPEQDSKQFFNLESGPGGTGCPGQTLPFAPGFLAGVADKTAGVHAPFSVSISRNDGEQNLSGVTVTTPPGFSATLRGIPYCPQAAIARLSAGGYTGIEEQASPSCPAASQVGTSVAAAGTGTRPVHVSGRVFLAGPYRGSQLSLLVVTPTVTGPYDLGNVVVRVPLTINPVNAQVTAVSDPIPQIIEGVPLRLRSLLISLDRPGFTLNPTNCEPFQVQSLLSGAESGTTAPSSHFQVANCANLGYAPKLKLRVSGSMKRRGHPAIHAVLSTKPGEANTRRVSVTLPKGGLLDNAHIETICTRVQFAANACPVGSLIGRAEAQTSLLDSPLKGSVYLRASSNKLPDMVVDLEGQIDIQLVGRIDSVRGRLRTTFATVPDAPVTKFNLDLLGGKKGLLINSINLCSESRWGDVVMSGQNGIDLERRTKVGSACTKAERSAAKRQAQRAKGGRR
jgi:hypothetical protein